MQSRLLSKLPRIGIILLSGGEGRRMGGVDKGWCLYQQKPFVRQVLSALTEQYRELCRSGQFTRDIFISANRNLEDYLTLGCPVVSDKREGFCGPLSGVESVMLAGQYNNPDIERWITYPVDSPEVPTDYLYQMASVKAGSLGVWQANERDHFANLSLPCELLSEVTAYLNSGERSIKGWLAQFSDKTDYRQSCYADVAGGKSRFLNLNHQVDLI
ncbi:NTP transferase domain-containing protein [Hydrogenovibrio marinus]|nr:NTP transferase domain-containing protein [Hydrogenovibrio marinus]